MGVGVVAVVLFQFVLFLRVGSVLILLACVPYPFRHFSTKVRTETSSC